MKSLLFQWILRLFGYGLTAGAGVLGARYGETIGGCVGAVGGVLLNKATNTFIPKGPTLGQPR